MQTTGVAFLIPLLLLYLSRVKGSRQSAVCQMQTANETIAKEETNKEHKKEKESPIIQKPKVVKTGLINARINDMCSKLIALIAQEKLYQETELTLRHLADKT